MRTPLHLRGQLYITVSLLLIFTSFLASVATTSAAAAQGEECPEGLVYDADQDLCVLPEETDEQTDDVLDEDAIEDDLTDASDEEDIIDEEDAGDEDQLDEGEAVDEFADLIDEDDQLDEEDQMDVEDMTDAVDEEEDAVEEEPAYISEFTLLHFACEPGFDPTQNKDNSEGLWHLCNGSGKPQFTYHLYVDQELITTFGMTTGDEGPAGITLPAAQEEPIPAGYVTLVVDPVPGYVSSYVTCITDVRNRFDLEISNGTSVSFAADPDEAIECEWYHVPVDQSGGQSTGTSFSVTKYACQGDYKPDPQEDPWSFYSATCTETIAGQQFTLQQGEDGPTRQETGENGTFFLTDVPVSDPYVPPVWAIAERIPAGYGEPIVFCGPTGETKQAMPLSNGNAITLAFENGATEIACDWFNIPGDTQPATISIQSWLCESVAIAVEDLADECTEAASNVPFVLYSLDETLAESSTDDSGAVTFENVPPGELAIEEELPSGYGPVVVTCDHASTAFGQQQITPNIEYGNGFTIEIDAGDTLDCDWYNLPALGSDNGPNIAIEGYQCPPNTAVTADTPLDEALAQCINPAFSTTYEILIGEELITTAFSGGSGQVFFTKLPALQDGEIYSLRMMVPETDEVLVAHCDVDSGDGLYETIETPLQDGNRIDFELLEGTNMRCTWFYKLGVIVTPEPPSPGGTGEPAIVVNVRFCPPEIETQRGDYEDLCPYPGADVDLELTLDGEPAGTATSDESGRVEFAGGEEGGTYVLRHVPNPGFSLPAITCVKTTDGVASEPFYDALTEDTGFTFELEAGETIACSWYILVNPDLYVPKEDVEDEEAPPAGETSNVVTVQFWVCPEDTFDTATQEDLLLDCQPELEDRDLVVTVGDITSGHHITGTETWGFLEPLFILETGTDEAHSVWCSSTWIEDGEEMSEFPVAQDVVNGTLSLPVDNPGTTIFCDWFTYEPVVDADAGVEPDLLLDLPQPDMLLEFPGPGQGLEAFTIAQYGCLPAFDVTPPLPDPVPLSDLYCQGAGLTTIQYAVEINGAVYVNTSLQNIGPSTAWSYPDPAALPAGATRIKAVTPTQFQVLQVDCTSGPGNSVRHDNLDISADGWIAFETTPASNVWCSFRVGPTAAWQGPQIKIKSYTCNQSFDLYTTDSIQRSNNCSLDTVPISFDVTLGGVGAGYVLYDGNDWGEMLFTPTQPGGTGTLRLTQPSVSGYGGMPRVYCTIFAPAGATNLEPTMIEGVSIEIQAPNNTLVVCEWFRPLKTIG